MTQERQNGETLSPRDIEKLLGDKEAPTFPETIKVTPQWRKEAKKRPAAQSQEPTGRIELSAPKDPEHVIQVSEIIQQVIVERFPKGKIKEIRVVFKNSGVLQQKEVKSKELDFQ